MLFNCVWCMLIILEWQFEHCEILCSNNIPEINFSRLTTIQKLRNFVLKQNYGNKLFAVKDNLKTAEDNITEIIVNFLQLWPFKNCEILCSNNVLRLVSIWSQTIADCRSQIAESSAIVCDRLRSYGNTLLRSPAILRSWSQTIADDRRRWFNASKP